MSGHPLAPRAKEPTPKEARERREAMFELEKKIKTSARGMRAEVWKLAAFLSLWEEHIGWTALGYESLNEWLAAVDLGMGRTRFYDLIGGYRELTERKVKPAVIQSLEPTKVTKVLPAIRQGRAKVADAVDDVKELSYSDLREKYRDPASVRTDTGKEKKKVPPPPPPAAAEPGDSDETQPATNQNLSNSGGMATGAEAFYSEEHDCWFVPMASEIFDRETMVVERARLELRDGNLWITELNGD